ncbi:hypothetical protein L211DRAFT_854400 [Terfezia boudieri ATCC MYA-4762]|uniref:Uncharacterized protein n=1 Tax=Terfezia boudieri ATCC MYA-4762 TaxID=1051890 RepID=A0A3N4L5L7_9PEZI|nr:hypothetical protein L211DRAFT_854400 [Terfezia boudieri ATCC MYA-4762]
MSEFILQVVEMSGSERDYKDNPLFFNDGWETSSSKNQFIDDENKGKKKEKGKKRKDREISNTPDKPEGSRKKKRGGQFRILEESKREDKDGTFKGIRDREVLKEVNRKREEYLGDVLPEEGYYGSKEGHEKIEGKHFHFLIDIETTQYGSAPKIKGKNAHKTWDIMINGKIYHPNIVPVRDIDKAWHYIDKCNDINYPKHDPGETFDNIKDQCLSRVGHIQQNKWHYITSADMKEDFFECMKQMHPESYIRSFANVKVYVTEKYSEK